jgi:hypothetical protein
MNTRGSTTARKKPIRTTAELRCAAVFFTYLAFNLALGVVLYGAWTRESSPQADLTGWFIFGAASVALMVVLAVGLIRGSRFARWGATGVAVLLAISAPVVGILVLMYLCRPELDGRFH